MTATKRAAKPRPAPLKPGVVVTLSDGATLAFEDGDMARYTFGISSGAVLVVSRASSSDVRRRPLEAFAPGSWRYAVQVRP